MVKVRYSDDQVRPEPMNWSWPQHTFVEGFVNFILINKYINYCVVQLIINDKIFQI